MEDTRTVKMKYDAFRRMDPYYETLIILLYINFHHYFTLYKKIHEAYHLLLFTFPFKYIKDYVYFLLEN